MEFEDVKGIVDFAIRTITTAIVVLGAAVAWIRRPLISDINGLGNRVKKLEAEDEKKSATLEHLTRILDRGELLQAVQSERMGQVASGIERLSSLIEGLKIEIHSREVKLEGRLSHIESKMNVGEAVRDAIEEVSEALVKAMRGGS